MSRRRGTIDGSVCLRLLGLLLSGIFLLGCRLPTGDRHHLVVLDRNGLAIDPARTERSFLVGRGYPRLAGPQVDEYLRHLADEHRDRIHIRSYGLDSRGGEAPIEHGDFDDCAFWRASFYVPDGQSGWNPDDPG